MKYKININYDTGDSFNHYSDIDQELSPTWENIEVAKINLKMIQEHYKYHLDLTSIGRMHYDKKVLEEKQKEMEKKPWYPSEYPDVTMDLISDNGDRINIITFWTGYFESLNSAEIVPDTSDMKFVV